MCTPANKTENSEELSMGKKMSAMSKLSPPYDRIEI